MRLGTTTRRVAAALLAVAALGAGRSAGANESCREWMAEHRHWKVEVVRRYLHGGPERELDEAVFELLQREAYLTSCEQSVAGARDELVGWRLVGRLPEEYASAVLESLLDRAGFDVSLVGLFAGMPGMVAARPALGARWRERGAR